MRVSERDQVDQKLRRGLVHRHDPMFHPAFNDRIRPAQRHVVDRVKRYDRNLFFRFNQVAHLWELWRWKGLVVPRDVRAVPPDELVRRAVFVFKILDETNGFAEPDWHLLRRLHLADEWEKSRYTPDQSVNQLDAEDAIVRRRQKANMEQYVADWSTDNKSQIRSLVGGQTIISASR